MPVAAMPRQTFRDRLQRRRKGEEGKTDVRRVVGEAAEEDALIPADAEKLNGVSDPIRKGIKPVKDVVMEPRDPYGEKERLMTPSSALVAPDCTPDATKPLPPSGAGNPAGRFRTRDAEADQEGGARGGAIDAVLDRVKTPLPRDPDAVVTAESAYNLLRVPSPSAQHASETVATSGVSGQTILAEGQSMPAHVHSDGRAIFSAFRRFNG